MLAVSPVGRGFPLTRLAMSRRPTLSTTASLSLVLIAKIAWLAVVELRQPVDSIGEVAAVVESQVPHDDINRYTVALGQAVLSDTLSQSYSRN